MTLMVPEDLLFILQYQSPTKESRPEHHLPLYVPSLTHHHSSIFEGDESPPVLATSAIRREN
jgi:hypothetical protein